MRKQLIDSYGIAYVSKYDYYPSGSIKRISLTEGIREVCVLKDKRLLLVYDTELKIYDFTTHINTIRHGFQAGINNIIELPNNQIIFKSLNDDQIYILDLITMEVTNYPTSEEYLVDNMKMLPDGRIVFIDNLAYIHLFDKGKITPLLPGTPLRNIEHEHYTIPLEILSGNRIITSMEHEELEDEDIKGVTIVQINPDTQNIQYIRDYPDADIVSEINKFSDEKIAYTFYENEEYKVQGTKIRSVSSIKSIKYVSQDPSNGIMAVVQDYIIRFFDYNLDCNIEGDIIYLGVLDTKVIVITNKAMYIIE